VGHACWAAAGCLAKVQALQAGPHNQLKFQHATLPLLLPLPAPAAVAIAMHNIPEGICVAMPIYYATGSRWKVRLAAGRLAGVGQRQEGWAEGTAGLCLGEGG
jgi:hypothetical protein